MTYGPIQDGFWFWQSLYLSLCLAHFPSYPQRYCCFAFCVDFFFFQQLKSFSYFFRLLLTRNFRHDGHHLYFRLAFHLYLDLIGCLGELCHHPNMVRINKKDIKFDKIRMEKFITILICTCKNYFLPRCASVYAFRSRVSSNKRTDRSYTDAFCCSNELH